MEAPRSRGVSLLPGGLNFHELGPLVAPGLLTYLPLIHLSNLTCGSVWGGAGQGGLRFCSMGGLSFCPGFAGPRQLLIGLILAGATVLPSLQVRHHNFLTFDDCRYVTANPLACAAGLAPEPQEITKGFPPGCAPRNRGRLEQAIVMSPKTLAVAPAYPPAYNLLALAYAREKKFAEVMPLFKKAIQLNPHEASFYRNVSLAYRQLGKTAEAQAVLDQIRWLSGRKDKELADGVNGKKLGLEYKRLIHQLVSWPNYGIEPVLHPFFYA
jgi:hypothetical protein